MTYTSEQYKRDKIAMLGEFNRAIADAAERCKAATSIPAGSGTAVIAPEPPDGGAGEIR